MEFDRGAFNREVGLLLQMARKRQKLNQGQLAEQIGVPRATYASIESGRQRVHLDVVWRAAVVLGVSLSSLVPSPVLASQDPTLRTQSSKSAISTSTRVDELNRGLLSTSIND